MGRCFSCLEGPAAYPPVPHEAPTTFKLLAQLVGSDVSVNTEHGEKWLYIDNKSGWFSPKAEFEVQTYKTDDEPVKMLARCVIEGQDDDIKKESEWDGDSDDSDFSLDDLFDFDDDVEHKVKLKWKIVRKARFYDANGTKFCSIKFKVKGKSKAEVEYNENGDRGHPHASTKVKKAYHKIDWEEHLGEEDHVGLEFSNGHWYDWDRSFDCKLLEAVYDAQWGRDDVTVKVKEGVDPVKGLIVGFAIAYYFHPSRYAEQMNARAVQCV